MIDNIRKQVNIFQCKYVCIIIGACLLAKFDNMHWQCTKSLFLALKILKISGNTLKRNLKGYADLLSIYSFFTNWIHGKKRRARSSMGTPHCWGRLVFCDLFLKFIPPINIWKIWNDLRLFSKCWHVSLLRPWRSKDDQGWILRLQPSNFAIISESLFANSKK